MKGKVDWNREDVKEDLRRCMIGEGFLIQQDLAEKYGVSRNTINTQIRKLKKAFGEEESYRKRVSFERLF